MTTEVKLTEYKRYEIVNNKIYEINPILYRDGYYYQSRKDFEEFYKGYKNYLQRLSKPFHQQNKLCPFCTLKFQFQQKAFENPYYKYKFVLSPEKQKELWDKNSILISNINGWHKINELVIPRDHIINYDDVLEINENLFHLCLERWNFYHHQVRSLINSKNASYYGMVANLRAGQSVDHFHYHCYISTHSLRILKVIRESYHIGNTHFAPFFNVKISFDDHPILIAYVKIQQYQFDKTIEFLNANISSMNEISKCFHKLNLSLYGSQIPLSLGWFLIANNELNKFKLIHISVPMMRSGTIQNFQFDKFRKFDTKSMIQFFRRILIKNNVCIIE